MSKTSMNWYRLPCNSQVALAQDIDVLDHIALARDGVCARSLRLRFSGG